MTKKFFVHVSPKAAQGIRRVYEQTGAEVHAKVGADGNATVVVITQDKKPAQKRALVAA